MSSERIEGGGISPWSTAKQKSIPNQSCRRRSKKRRYVERMGLVDPTLDEAVGGAAKAGGVKATALGTEGIPIEGINKYFLVESCVTLVVLFACPSLPLQYVGRASKKVAS